MGYFTKVCTYKKVAKRAHLLIESLHNIAYMLIANLRETLCAKAKGRVSKIFLGVEPPEFRGSFHISYWIPHLHTQKFHEMTVG